MKDKIISYAKENKYLLLAMFLLSIHLLYMVYDTYQIDYRAGFVAGQAFLDGLNPMQNNFLSGYRYQDSMAAFSPSRFVYPPQALFLYIPFCLTKSYMVSKLCFAVFNLICLFSLMLFLKKLYPLRNELVILIMFSIPTWTNFERGQVYIFITLLLVLAYHYRDKLWAGALAIFPAFLRMFPFAVLLYFLYRKKYRLFVSSVVFGIIIFILGIFYFGPMAFADFLSNLYALENPAAIKSNYSDAYQMLMNIPQNDFDRIHYIFNGNIANHLSYFGFSRVNFLGLITSRINLPCSENVFVFMIVSLLMLAFLFYIRKKQENPLYFYIFMMFIIFLNLKSFNYTSFFYVPFAFYAASKYQENFKMILLIMLPLFLPTFVSFDKIYLSMLFAVIAIVVFLIKDSKTLQTTDSKEESGN